MKILLSYFSIFTLAGASALYAQVPPPEANNLPDLPGLKPVVDAGAVIYENGFQESNMDGQGVADLYRTLTKDRVRVLVSSEAAAAEFRFIQPGPLTGAEAIELLEKQLLMENFVLVKSGENQVKLVLNSSTEVPIINGVQNFPVADRLITYDMELSHLSADDAARTFQQIIGSDTGTTVVPVPNAQLIVITAKSQVIKKLIKLKDRIDVPPSDINRRWVPVKYADVEEIAEILNQIFGQSSGGGGGGGARRGAAGGGAPNPAAAAAAAAAGVNAKPNDENPPQIIPDRRTNRIFLLGRPIDLVFIEDLIADFDKPTDTRNIRRKKLNFMKVTEFLETAEQALMEPSNSQAGGAQGGQGGGAGRSSGGGGNTRGGTRGGGGGGGGAGGGGGGGGDVLQAEEIDSTPIPVRVGKTLLVADPSSNSLIFSGPPQKLEIIENLIAQLDIRPAQIMIAAVFGQMTLSENQETVFSALSAADPGGVGGGVNNGGIPFGDGAIGLATGLFGGNGTISVFGEIGDFTAFFSALSTNTDFQLLARPSVFTSNNEKAVLSSGRRIAVPTGTNNFGGNTSNVQTQFEYQNVELKLEVIPLVNSDNEVTLEIALISDTVGADRPVGNDLDIPDIITRQIITKITVPNRSTVALGGLITTETTDEKQGVPLLKDLPLLGKLFSSHDTDSERDELVIFIQPTITSSDFGLAGVQSDFNARHEISRDAMGLANGAGMLPEVGSFEPVVEQSRPKPKPRKKVARRQPVELEVERQPVSTKSGSKKENFFGRRKR